MADFWIQLCAPWAAPSALAGVVLPLGLLLALAIDWRWGEPPARLHPVVAIGHVLGWWGKRLGAAQEKNPDWPRFWLAALVWCVLAAMVFAFYTLLQAGVLSLPWWLAAPLMALLLKPLMAWRMLASEVRAVEAALQSSLGEGRERLSWLVSRSVDQLSAAEVRESAIETLAENLNDSVVAPLFWFALLGLPGAALYRLANTADAMWGYPGWRGGRYWQWAGKWTARADDVLSWLPARITTLLLALACGGVPWRSLRAQSSITPSPNGGWPMACMALALGVRLGKPLVYTLNPEGRAPEAADVQRAIQLAGYVVKMLAALAGIVLAAMIFKVMMGQAA